MAWKESDRVSERLDFAKLASVEGGNFAELCRRFGVSRKTGYKWLQRWQEEGPEGLVDRSRRPTNSPNRTCGEVEAQVLAIRQQHPAWGGRKIRRRLEELQCCSVPSASTITSILHRHGCISEKASSKAKAFTKFERSEPNELWQLDFKGDFELSSGSRSYPLTILDDHSRYSLGIIACGNQRRDTVEQHLCTTFRRYGIPQSIHVDNGPPWGASFDARHTRLSVWLMCHDINVIHGRPYHPQGRGKLERFHRTLQLEVLQDRNYRNLESVQSDFNPWRDIYNHERPHDALELSVPASRYCASERCFNDVTKPFEYSSRFKTRKTSAKAYFSFHGANYRVSEAFAGKRLGLSPTSRDGVWDIYFRRFVVGQVDERAGTTNRRQPKELAGVR